MYETQYLIVKGGDLPASSDVVDVLFDGMIHISLGILKRLLFYTSI